MAGINTDQLYQQVNKYKTLGYNRLINKSKKRTPKISKMKATETIVNVNIRMQNFDDVQCTIRSSAAYGFVIGMESPVMANHMGMV